MSLVPKSVVVSFDDLVEINASMYAALDYLQAHDEMVQRVQMDDVLEDSPVTRAVKKGHNRLTNIIRQAREEAR